MSGGAALFLEGSRANGICCRYGGEEFLVVLPGMARDAALARAQAFLQKVVDRQRHADSQPVVATLLVGAACIQRVARSSTELVDRADRALCQAKAEGRNRACAASSAAVDGAESVASPRISVPWRPRGCGLIRLSSGNRRLGGVGQQPMPHACTVAGIAAGRKFAAG